VHTKNNLLLTDVQGKNTKARKNNNKHQKRFLAVPHSTLLLPYPAILMTNTFTIPTLNAFWVLDVDIYVQESLGHGDLRGLWLLYYFLASEVLSMRQSFVLYNIVHYLRGKA